MKPIPHSALRPAHSTDPEAAMQEHHSLMASAIMCLFLALFWIQDRWSFLTAKYTNHTKGQTR